ADRTGAGEFGCECARCDEQEREADGDHAKRGARRKICACASAGNCGEVRVDRGGGYRARDGRADEVENLRAIFHDQGAGEGDWARSFNGVWNREAERRIYLGGQRGESGDALRDFSAADDGGGFAERAERGVAANESRS